MLYWIFSLTVFFLVYLLISTLPPFTFFDEMSSERFDLGFCHYD